MSEIDWKKIKQQVQESEDLISRINEVLEFHNLPPEIVEQIKKNRKKFKIGQDRHDLVIKS